jgi:hypothetical protein
LHLSRRLIFAIEAKRFEVLEDFRRQMMKCMRLFSFVLLASFLVLIHGRIIAQVSTATISGVVRDQQGAVIPDAALVLRNIDTQVTNRTTSNSAGAYEILSLNPGSYTLEASKPGFTTRQVPAFTLTVSQIATVDLTLAVGSQSTVVTVEGAAPILDTAQVSLGTVIGSNQVNDLPLNGRNFTELLTLTPGVTSANTSQNSSPCCMPVALGSTVTTPSVNGQSNRSDFFLTDSLPNEEAQFTTYGVPPVIDDILEFKVVSHPDDAEYGSVMGGIINVVTKSGTNTFHGSAWDYYRDQIFDARTYFLPVTVQKTPFHQNQFGASVGGPVLIPKLYNGKNRTFFFGDYEGFRYGQTSDTPLLVPTAAQLAGNEGRWPTQIYNPFTTTPSPGNPGQYIRQPFSGNQIPPGLIDSRMVAWAQFVFPAAGPVIDSRGDNALDTTPVTQTENQWDIRVDESLGSKNSLWFRYSRIADNKTTSGGLPGVPDVTTIPGTNYGGSFVHIFSPTLVLQLQGGYESVAVAFGTQFAKSTAAIFQQIGFASSFAGDFSEAPGPTGGNLLPGPGIVGFSNAGDNFEGADKAGGTTDLSSAGGTLTKIWGTHSLKFGASYSGNYYNDINAVPTIGFAAQETGDTNPADTVNAGDPLASFLLNVPDSAQRRNEVEKELRGGVFSVFGEDSWQITHRLTLNYGLRYDLTSPPPFGTLSTVGQQGGVQTGDIDFNNGTYILNFPAPPCSSTVFAPCIPGGPTLPANVVQGPSNHNLMATNYHNFGPRLGFSYKLDGRTVIHGGFGIVYDNWTATFQASQDLTGGWPGIGNEIGSNLNQPTASSPTPTIQAENPFANLGSTALDPPATPFGEQQTYYDPRMDWTPYSEQWAFGVERQLGSSTTATLNYVGSTSKHLDVGGYYNTALTPGPGNPQSRNLYNYIVPTHYDRSDGFANYNALQVSLDKRYRAGIGLQVSYTWSKTMDAGTDGWYGGGNPTDPYHIAAYGNYSPAGYDVTNNLVVNTLYQIPVGKGKRFSTGKSWLDYIIGDWQENNIFSASSGLPYGVTISSDIANTGNGGDYEPLNRIGNPHLSHSTPGEWFNRSAFAVPAGYTYGNAGRNSLRTEAQWDLDSSVFRNFPIGGERNFQFRAEAFNLANHAVFGYPAANYNDGATFGTVDTTFNNPRELQFAVKFSF